VSLLLLRKYFIFSLYYHITILAGWIAVWCFW
jgi:hypothetical protein